MFHNLFDSHVHTNNSKDGIHSPMYLAEQAQMLGFSGVAFTDHLNAASLNTAEPLRSPVLKRMVQLVVDVAKTKNAFRRMTFSQGVEIGMSGGFEPVEQVLAAYPFDFVMGAIHRREDGWSYADAIAGAAGERESGELLSEYYARMLALARWDGYDALAHFTYPLRAAMRDHGVRLDLTPHREAIDEILATVAQKGKAIEINTSGLRTPLGETMPPLWVVSRFRELGGKYVTIGSDAHRMEEIGAGIVEAMELLRQAGFEQFAVYRKREPVLLRIV